MMNSAKPLQLEPTTREAMLESGWSVKQPGTPRPRPSLAPTAYGLPTLKRSAG